MSVLVRSLSLLCVLSLTHSAFVDDIGITLRMNLIRYQNIQEKMKEQYEAFEAQKVTMMNYNQDLLHMVEHILPDSTSLEEVTDRTKKFTYESDHLLDLILQDLKSQIHKYEQLIEKYKNYVDFLEEKSAELRKSPGSRLYFY
ncbi:hypothetical protein NL108_013799 [Boleophthalmus pectinirostris]|nr:hypothetical protein NL108_013799 [Boleophthalmus pectinirostris]